MPGIPAPSPFTALGRIFGALSVAVVVACAAAPVEAGGAETAPALGTRPLSPEDIVLDFSPAAQVLDIWAGKAEEPTEWALAIVRDVSYRTLREFFTTQMNCVPSDAEVARAIVEPETGGVCGFGLEPAWKDRASIDSLLYTLVERATTLRAVVARDAGLYVPETPWKPIRVWFVIASRWMFDAVTLDRPTEDALPVVLFNLSEALEYGGNTEERAAIVERVLAHETFHAALRQVEYGSPGWLKYHEPRNAYDHIARVVLDEGVAHYVDWKGRAGADTLFVVKPGARERKAFDQLARACRRLRDPRTDPGERAEILGMASTGPLWSKYGAISGMFAASRVDRAWGADSLRSIVESGPESFLRAYGAVAAADTSLKALPTELYKK